VAVLKEVKEIIELPAFDPAARRASNGNYGAVMIDETVLTQLRQLVFAISQTYHKNPFHSFEHASHVCMSVGKLMSRIVAPDVEFVNENQLHDHTYGITSDPLTQFSVMFAALIHDADHQGVPNDTLVREEASIAKLYNGKSVAEQNSVNKVWDILMQDQYAELRNAICATQEEVGRFRHLVVNAVMATDIMDKDLKKLRDDRWKCAFSNDQRPEEPETTTVNRKATIGMSILNFLPWPELQIISSSHTTISFYCYSLQSLST
jgi:3'5'-cyclic nucleotide phosphodiesterase